LAAYAIGDIHGQAKTLKSLILKLNLKSDDHIIFLGDYIDRGPDWFEVLKYIISLENIYKVTVLWGNHDILMYDSLRVFKESKICPDISSAEKRETWFYNGGKKTYNKFIRLSADDKQLVSDFFGKLRTDISLNINNQEYTLCHSLPGEVGDTLWDASWARLACNDSGEIYYDSYIDETLLFEKYKNQTIVHGHTPVFNYIDSTKLAPVKYKLGNVKFINIDLGAGFIGRITGANLCALRLDDMKEFYAV